MDTLRGHEIEGGRDDFDDADDAAIECPPAITAHDRRMQIRAYNYWASLLGDRALPSIEDLQPDRLEDFGPYSVLLDFSAGVDNPAVIYMGTALRRECEISGPISHIGDVPSRSLLSRLTDHYLQIIANAAPIGFEAEFVNQRGADLLYRGILMPFSSDDETIDFVFGVINWKEAASRAETDALEREVSEALGLPRDAEQEGLADPSVLDLTASDMIATPGPDADASLADWLAAARDGAEQARAGEARSHGALYHAIGLAYDFALAAQAAPEDYAELLADAGIKAQARSPMTAVVKLIFGAAYDKTRLTEYAAALDHARARDMERGALAAYLSAYEGGLKALVRDVRASRRADRPARPDRGRAARDAIRAAPPLTPQSILTDADGLAILVARREGDGSLAIVAALPEGSPLGAKVMLAAMH
ncbi:PAS domain-containing protein [Sphingobium cloacae]|uniref:PAS domain-containing protein n=1 Tax=Sphingobium cloacae TaxID=120107 RepID=A0A1E1F6X3_9SPHN|nr:hypothetical protein [Sphingobium cloacae]BAV66263.1 hypothetical protein SCLO_1032230 [Sphingobium cloacae]